jgi:hypothetical protein
LNDALNDLLKQSINQPSTVERAAFSDTKKVLPTALRRIGQLKLPNSNQSLMILKVTLPSAEMRAGHKSTNPVSGIRDACFKRGPHPGEECNATKVKFQPPG